MAKYPVEGIDCIKKYNGETVKMIQETSHEYAIRAQVILRETNGDGSDSSDGGLKGQDGS